MKLNITNLIFFGMGLLLVTTSCKKEGGYDWTKIEPGKQQITGPDSIKGNDSTVYEYLAMTRGGSTYTWAVLSGPLTIKIDTLNHDPLHYHPYRIEVTANSAVNTSGSIVVRETTWAGKQGESDTFNIQKILCYSPFNINEFEGDYICDETILNISDNTFNSPLPFNVKLTRSGGDTVQIDNFYGIGIPLYYIISEDKNESLKVVTALTDEINTSYFTGTMEIRGTGYYSSCNKTITVNFALVDHTIGDTLYTGTDLFKHQ